MTLAANEVSRPLRSIKERQEPQGVCRGEWREPLEPAGLEAALPHPGPAAGRGGRGGAAAAATRSREPACAEGRVKKKPWASLPNPSRTLRAHEGDGERTSHHRTVRGVWRVTQRRATASVMPRPVRAQCACVRVRARACESQAERDSQRAEPLPEGQRRRALAIPDQRSAVRGARAFAADLWAPAAAARAARPRHEAFATAHRPAHAAGRAARRAARALQAMHHRQRTRPRARTELAGQNTAALAAQPGMGGRPHLRVDRGRLALRGRSARPLQPPHPRPGGCRTPGNQPARDRPGAGHPPQRHRRRAAPPQ